MAGTSGMTTLSRSLLPQPLRTTPQTMVQRGLVAAIILFVTVVFSVLFAIGTFPESWNLGLRVPIDHFESWVIGHRATHPLFVYGFTPFSNFIENVE